MAGGDSVTILVANPVPPSWRDAAAAVGAREVAAAGGALSLALPDAPAALACAARLQRGAGDAEVRIGIHAGGDDAAVLAVATRLCTEAGAGGVLVSHAVHAGAAGHGGQAFRDAGALDLDGAAGAVRAWELLWREPAPRTRIRLCGPLRLEVDGRDLAPGLPGGQAGSLLRYLLASRDHAADRDELVDVVWPGRRPSDPQAGLRPILSRLRRAVAPATLEGRERLRLALPAPVWLDVGEATRALETARAAARSADWESVREQAEAALDLLRPGLLPDCAAEWAAAPRREAEELELEALEWVARSALSLGGPELAAAERAGRELIARSPFRETGHRFQMEALAGAGNAAEALRVYDRLRVLLREELGAAPAPELQALHARLLGGEGTASGAAPVPAAPSHAAAPRVPLPAALSPHERSAFVGRERELGLLRAAWGDARAGRRRLVVVAGEPGIGKTRLTSELAREAHDKGTVLYASCPEEALVSYQPFAEALRHYARTTGFDRETVARSPGAAELARLVPELAEHLPAHAGPPPGDPQTRRFLMFEAVSALLAEASSRAPLALVLDDLHWADRATLHLLRHLIRAPQETALLVVGTYRDAEVAADHPLAGLLADLRRERLVERVSLEGLDERGVGALITAHAGHEAPSALVGTVHEETEGNPFFVEEVMRHLIETGVLVERGGRWASALTADEIGVPEGVEEVISRRLGRLSGGCRSTLSEAAVLGRRFDFELLRRMADRDEEALIVALEEAAAAQLVVEAGDGSAYAFTHALVRETLYGALSGPRRQRMHARAAQAIEAAHGEREVAALAVHHRLAGPAGDAAKAVEFSLRAGHQARELSAWDEAAGHWDGALEVMTRAGGRRAERAALLVALADLMVVTGDLGRQIDCLERALALDEELGDAERAAQVHSRLGMAHSLIDSIYADHLDIRRAFRHFDAATPVLEAGPVRKARGHLETGIASALTYGLDVPRGLDAAGRGMEIGERLGDEVLWAGAAQAHAWHSIVAGELREGFATLEPAFAVADRHQRPFLAWMGSNIRGQLTWGLGAPDEARAFFERPLHLPYAGRAAYWPQIADGVGRCHASAGEVSEARRLLADATPTWITHSLEPLLDLWDGNWDAVQALARDVLETSRRTGNRWDEWAAHHLAARVLHLRGDLARAGELLERSLAIVAEGGARYFELWVRPDLARVRADTGALDDARAHVERCREITGAGEDWRGRAGHVALADAVVLAREGRTDEADAAFADACATLDRHRLRGDQADALHQWGRALARAGAADAPEKLDAALELYRGHGAGDAWLERVAADRRGLV